MRGSKRSIKLLEFDIREAMSEATTDLAIFTNTWDQFSVDDMAVIQV